MGHKCGYQRRSRNISFEYRRCDAEELERWCTAKSSCLTMNASAQDELSRRLMWIDWVPWGEV